VVEEENMDPRTFQRRLRTLVNRKAVLLVKDLGKIADRVESP